MAPSKKRVQGSRLGNKVLQDAGRATFFNVETMDDILKDGFKGTVDPKASVFLMGVIQYIAAELIEVSVNSARGNTPPGETFEVTPADIKRGLESDAELRELYNGDEKALLRRFKTKH